MAKPKRHVPTSGAERYTLSELNPNDGNGGWCACGPHPEDQQGPFIVFHGAVTAGNKAVRPVVCAACAKSAVLSVERGDDVGIVGPASPKDLSFDGGTPDAPSDVKRLHEEYNAYAIAEGLARAKNFSEWLEDRGLDMWGRSLRGGLDETGVDPNAKSLLQARADTTPVGMRGGAVHGRIDDPVEHASNPDSWGTPGDD